MKKKTDMQMVNFTEALLHCWTGYAVILSTFWVYKYVVKMKKNQ